MGLLDLFSKKENKGIIAMSNALHEAFGKLRQETTNIFAWLRYLREKDVKNDWNHEQINYILGEHDALIEGIKKDIEELKGAIKMQQRQVRTGSFPDPDRTETGPKIYGNFEKKVLEQIRTRKKDYVLQQMLNLATKNALSTKQIERIIVGEKELCGRTTFYDYLKELKHKNLIKTDVFGAKTVLKTAQNETGSDLVRT